MCYRIDEIEKKDDRSWCLVDKRCRKVLKKYKYKEKADNYFMLAILIIIFSMPFIALFCEVCGKCK